MPARSSRSWSRAARLLTFALGFAGTGAAIRGLTAMERPSAQDARLPSTTLEDDAAKPNKIVIISTACWVYTSDSVFNVERDAYDASWSASMPSVMNFLLRTEYENPNGCGAYLVGAAHAQDFESHLLTLLRVLSVPGVRTVVYANAPGSLATAVRPASALAAVPALETIERECPAVAAEAREYRKALVGSRGYHLALEDKERHATFRDEQDMTTFRWALSRHRAGAELLRIDGGLDRARAVCLWEERTPTVEQVDLETRALLDACARTYDHPATHTRKVRRMVPRDQFWTASGGERVWRSWFRIAAELCRERGVRLVFYVPPHVHVTDEEYASAFRPLFVDKVATTLADLPNVSLIDHANRHELKPADLTFLTINRTDGKRVELKLGFLFNIIGQLKRCRLLIDALAATEGFVKRPGVACWDGEARLPPSDEHLSFVPEEERALVEDSVLRPETLRLTEPDHP
jgi:hypothetical protein